MSTPSDTKFNISTKPFIYNWERGGRVTRRQKVPLLGTGLASLLAPLWMFPPNLQPTVPRRTPFATTYTSPLSTGKDCTRACGLPTCVRSLIGHLLTSRSRPWETDRLETNSNSPFSLGFMQNSLMFESHNLTGSNMRKSFVYRARPDIFYASDEHWSISRSPCTGLMLSFIIHQAFTYDDLPSQVILSSPKYQCPPGWVSI